MTAAHVVEGAAQQVAAVPQGAHYPRDIPHFTCGPQGNYRPLHGCAGHGALSTAGVSLPASLAHFPPRALLPCPSLSSRG